MRAGCSCCSWVKGKHPWQTPIWSCRFWWKRWSGSDPLGTHLRGAGGRSGRCLPPGTCCRKCHHLALIQKRYLQLVLMLWKSLQSTGGEFEELGFESFLGGARGQCSHTLCLTRNCFVGWFLWHILPLCIFLWPLQHVTGELGGDDTCSGSQRSHGGKGQVMVSHCLLCLFPSRSATALFPFKAGNKAVKIIWSVTTCPTWERRNFFREHRLYGSVEQLGPGHLVKVCSWGWATLTEPTPNTAWRGAISV